MPLVMLSLSFLLPIGCDTDPPYRGIRTHTVDPAGPENEEPESDPPEKEEEAPADWTDEGTIPVEIDALFDHLEALQTIADDNDGNRSAGSPGSGSRGAAACPTYSSTAPSWCRGWTS